MVSEAIIRSITCAVFDGINIFVSCHKIHSYVHLFFSVLFINETFETFFMLIKRLKPHKSL